MCTPQCICEKLGGLGFEEAIRAGKYVRHYSKNLQKLKDKLKDLDDCTEKLITREVSVAGVTLAKLRDDEIEVNDWHWRTNANKFKADNKKLIRESTTKANISCIACLCPNIVWRYKFSKQAEEKIAEAVELIGTYNNFHHQISYVENLQKLKYKLRDLDDCRETITRKVSEANGRGDKIEVNVSHWQTDAGNLKDDIEQLIRESTTEANICSTFESPFPDITWQYNFIKQAEEKIANADGLIIKYNNFNQISHMNYLFFDSRASIFKDIMDALKDSNVNMIGVFGLGGVGKTTLVREVGEQTRKDGTFKQVAMAVVSKDLNVKEVQSRLAASLNFKFKAEVDDQVGRATELWNKLTNGDKYLIILDDIWEGVKMEAIGIPCTNGKKGCKVVLTSRNEDLLSLKPESSVHPLQLFNKLTVLIIENFKLKYLFPPTTARGLVHLGVLKVTSCEIMEGIVGFEGQKDENEITGEVKFSKLKQLKLTSLPSLISFFAKKEEMGTTMGSFSARAQPLFNEQVIFPIMESLTIEGLDNIITIWGKQSIAIWQEQGSFCQLTYVNVYKCEKLMHVFPSNMHPLLKNLAMLRVCNCETMMGIAEFEGEIVEDGLRNEVILPVLEVLEVDRLGNIVEIWDKQSPWFNEHPMSFGKLRDVKVQCCAKLMNLVPSYILPNLQKLCVEGCPKIESVVFKNEKGAAADDSTMIIPQLWYLRISDMENLKSFYSSSTASNAQSLFNHQVILPVLEVLEVDRWGNIVEIWDKQSPLFNEHTVSFGKLRDVKVQRCKKLMKLVPSNILPNLQKLCVEGCPKIESVVFKNEKEGAAADDSPMIIPQLQYLRISDMENLKSFYSSSTASNAQSLFNHQVTCPSLKILELEGCASLRNIFHPCMVKVLQNLRELIVNDCSKMESVIDKEEEQEDRQQRKTDKLELRGLSKLKLCHLPELRTFCHFTRPLELRPLSKMVICDCPRMDSFSSGPVSTPNLSVTGFSRNG